jgi:hypothetical protein
MGTHLFQTVESFHVIRAPEDEAGVTGNLNQSKVTQATPNDRPRLALQTLILTTLPLQ